MNITRRSLAGATAALLALPLLLSPAHAQGTPLTFGVGMFQPDREKTMPPTALWSSTWPAGWVGRCNYVRWTAGRAWPRAWPMARLTSP
jgi:hypothetical protein